MDFRNSGISLLKIRAMTLQEASEQQ